MRMKSLTLFSKNLKRLKGFYQRNLEFQITDDNSHSFRLKTRYSELRFIESDHTAPYHFAITIPSNLEAACLHWLGERVEILKFAGREMIEFDNWNARSMYFYDTDNNIVEFISRRNLSFQSNRKFGVESLVEISEIGLATDNIQNVHEFLFRHFKLKIFDGGFESFCAIGDERGLFIVVDKDNKKWFPTDDDIHVSDFIVVIDTPTGDAELKYIDGKMEF